MVGHEGRIIYRESGHWESYTVEPPITSMPRTPSVVQGKKRQVYNVCIFISSAELELHHQVVEHCLLFTVSPSPYLLHASSRRRCLQWRRHIPLISAFLHSYPSHRGILHIP